MENSKALGYFVLRLCLGINISMHGISRLLSGDDKFVTGVMRQFQSTFLPSWSVHAFGLTLPWVEAAIGLLVLVGLFTRGALVAGGLVIAVLTFGISLVQQWDVAGIQLTYALAFAALLILLEHNHFSVDQLIAGRRSSARSAAFD